MCIRRVCAHMFSFLCVSTDRQISNRWEDLRCIRVLHKSQAECFNIYTKEDRNEDYIKLCSHHSMDDFNWFYYILFYEIFQCFWIIFSIIIYKMKMRLVSHKFGWTKTRISITKSLFCSTIWCARIKIIILNYCVFT